MVNDDERFLSLLSTGLRRLYESEVVTALVGRTAMRRFEQSGPFDCVLIDQLLPDCDGTDLANQMRASAAAGVNATDPGVPIIVISKAPPWEDLSVVDGWIQQDGSVRSTLLEFAEIWEELMAT